MDWGQMKQTVFIRPASIGDQFLLKQDKPNIPVKSDGRDQMICLKINCYNNHICVFSLNID